MQQTKHSAIKKIKQKQVQQKLTDKSDSHFIQIRSKSMSTVNQNTPT